MQEKQPEPRKSEKYSHTEIYVGLRSENKDRLKVNFSASALENALSFFDEPANMLQGSADSRQEMYGVLFGRIDSFDQGGKVQVLEFVPMQNTSGSPIHTNFNGLEFGGICEQMFDEKKYVPLGTIHTHPGMSSTFLSEHDLNVNRIVTRRINNALKKYKINVPENFGCLAVVYNPVGRKELTMFSTGGSGTAESGEYKAHLGFYVKGENMQGIADKINEFYTSSPKERNRLKLDASPQPPKPTLKIGR